MANETCNACTARARSACTIFTHRKDHGELRIWNAQLISYAGYRNEDGTITGDPSNVVFTEVPVILQLKWNRLQSTEHFLDCYMLYDDECLLLSSRTDMSETRLAFQKDRVRHPTSAAAGRGPLSGTFRNTKRIDHRAGSGASHVSATALFSLSDSIDSP